MKSRVIIAVTGKACQAFKLFDLFCQEYGSLTLGKLARKLTRGGYCIIWRADG